MSKLPDLHPAAVEEAMRRFDAEYRDTDDKWRSWPTRADKNAILWHGRRYPPKFVIHLATGRELAAFSGGPEVNAYLVRRGFEIVRLRPEEDLPGERIRGYLVHSLLLQEGPAPVLAKQKAEQWAICCEPDVLNRRGEWEWEPNGSERDDEFLARTRFDTLDQALDAWETWKQRQDEQEQ